MLTAMAGKGKGKDGRRDGKGKDGKGKDGKGKGSSAGTAAICSSSLQPNHVLRILAGKGGRGDGRHRQLSIGGKLRQTQKC